MLFQLLLKIFYFSPVRRGPVRPVRIYFSDTGGLYIIPHLLICKPLCIKIVLYY